MLLRLDIRNTWNQDSEMKFIVRFLLGLLPILCHLSVQGNRPYSWNQLRGPNGSGFLKDSRPPIKIEKYIAWKTAIPPGLSSPALSEKKIFLTAIDEGRLVTLAIDKATGEIVWNRKAPAVPIEKFHKASSPATPTPYVDEDRLFVYFGSYGLLCYDHDGKELWKKPIATPKSLYGMSTSPVVYKDKVILVLDNDANAPKSKLSQSKVLALNKNTGETAWETPRPFQRSGWSTPMINGAELVILGNGRLCGYDLPTGEEKWHVTGFSRETISMPFTGNDLIFGSASKLGGASDAQTDPEPFWKAVISFDSNEDNKLERKEMTGHFTFPFRPELPPRHPGYGLPLPKDDRQRQKRLDGMFHWMDKNKDGFWTQKEFVSNISIGHGKPLLVAIRPGGKGNVTDTHVEWELNRGIPEIPTPVFFEDRIYMVCNGGVLAGVDASNGKLIYRERLGGFGQYSASPVVANGHLYLASEAGLVSVVKTGDKFEIAHWNDLGESIHVTPALDFNTLYLRSEKHLWAFRNSQ